MKQYQFINVSEWLNPSDGIKDKQILINLIEKSKELIKNPIKNHWSTIDTIKSNKDLDSVLKELMDSMRDYLAHTMGCQYSEQNTFLIFIDNNYIGTYSFFLKVELKDVIMKL